MIGDIVRKSAIGRIGNIRKMTTQAGGIISNLSSKAKEGIQKFEDIANKVDKITGGAAGDILRGSGTIQQYQSYKAPVMTGLKAAELFGSSLKRLGGEKLTQSNLKKSWEEAKEGVNIGKSIITK
jgi:hypothetical protein